jgi:hypothetical protein
MPYLIDIPDQSARNVVLSLMGIADPRQLALTNVPERLPSDAGLDFTSTVVSLDAMANFGYTSSVNISAKVGEKFHYIVWNLLATKDYPEKADGLIRSTRWGIGVRIGITAFNVDAKVHGSNASDIAAAASLNMASAIYEVQVLGGNLETLNTLKPLISQSAGPFNNQTLEMLGAVQGALSVAIKKQREAMIPSLLQVELDARRLLPKDKKGSLKELMASQNFALERAWRRETGKVARERALKEKPQDVVPELVEEAYSSILHLQPDAPVSGEKVKEAHHVLEAGR